MIKKLLFILSLTSIVAHAQTPGLDGGGGGGSSSPGGLFHFSLGLKGGIGSNGSADDTIIEKRDHYVYGAEANLGFHLSFLLLGVGYEYQRWGQRTSPGDVDDTNTSGTQTNMVGIIGFNIGSMRVMFKPYINSEFNLLKEDPNGNAVIYSKPAGSSYSMQLLFSTSASRYIGLDFLTATYESASIGGSDTDLDKDSSLTKSATMLVYGILF